MLELRLGKALVHFLVCPTLLVGGNFFMFIYFLPPSIYWVGSRDAFVVGWYVWFGLAITHARAARTGPWALGNKLNLTKVLPLQYSWQSLIIRPLIVVRFLAWFFPIKSVSFCSVRYTQNKHSSSFSSLFSSWVFVLFSKAQFVSGGILSCCVNLDTQNEF